MYDELIEEGYLRLHTLPFAFPVHSFSLDLEVSYFAPLRASERTVLRLVDCGIRDIASVALHMGLGDDVRLAATVATELLSNGAIGFESGALKTTPVGRDMLAQARQAMRERVMTTVYYRALDDAWSFVSPQGDMRGIEETIELATAPRTPTACRTAIGELVRAEGAPELNERIVQDEQLAVELLGFQELNARVFYERVEIEMWKHATDPTRRRYVGLRDGLPDEAFTRLIAKGRYEKKRKRFVIGGPSTVTATRISAPTYPTVVVA